MMTAQGFPPEAFVERKKKKDEVEIKATGYLSLISAKSTYDTIEHNGILSSPSRKTKV